MEEAVEEEDIEERLYMRGGVGIRNSHQRKRRFLPFPNLSTETAVAGGTCSGPLYRCDGSGQWMEGQESNTRRNRLAIDNVGSVLWWRRRQRRRQKQRRKQSLRQKRKLARIVRN